MKEAGVLRCSYEQDHLGQSCGPNSEKCEALPSFMARFPTRTVWHQVDARGAGTAIAYPVWGLGHTGRIAKMCGVLMGGHLRNPPKFQRVRETTRAKVQLVRKADARHGQRRATIAKAMDCGLALCRGVVSSLHEISSNLRLARGGEGVSAHLDTQCRLHNNKQPNGPHDYTCNRAKNRGNLDHHATPSRATFAAWAAKSSREAIFAPSNAYQYFGAIEFRMRQSRGT